MNQSNLVRRKGITKCSILQPWLVIKSVSTSCPNYDICSLVDPSRINNEYLINKIYLTFTYLRLPTTRKYLHNYIGDELTSSSDLGGVGSGTAW